MGKKVVYYKVVYFLSVSFLFFAGCVFIKHAQQLSVLGAVGKSQKEISIYVDKQRRLFRDLVEDIKKGNLTKGLTASEVVRRYGEPVLSWKDRSNSFHQKLLYRDPVNFFTSDKVYLYFDRKDKLIFWEYVPMDS